MTELISASDIDDILSSHLEIEPVPYSMIDGAMQISYESRQTAAEKIVEEIQKRLSKKN